MLHVPNEDKKKLSADESRYLLGLITSKIRVKYSEVEEELSFKYQSVPQKIRHSGLIPGWERVTCGEQGVNVAIFFF